MPPKPHFTAHKAKIAGANFPRVPPQRSSSIIVVILKEEHDLALHPFTPPDTAYDWGWQSPALLSHLLANPRQPHSWMAGSILNHIQLCDLAVACYAHYGIKVFICSRCCKVYSPKSFNSGLLTKSVSPAVGTTYTAQSKRLQVKHPSHPVLVRTPQSWSLPPLEQFSTT